MTKIEYAYRPNKGFSTRVIERGVPSYIFGLVNAYRNDGFNVTTRRTGPYAELAAEVADVNTVAIVERWSVTNEIIEKDLFTLPNAMVEASAFTKGKAAYRNGITNAVDEGKTLPAAYAGFLFASTLYQELSRGVTGYEREYVVLSKERTFPINATQTLNLTSTRTIYTTNQLISVAQIPPAVQFSLPNPANGAEPQTMWGWRTRDQEAEIASDFTVTLRARWVFAQWSTFLYTPA